ncbi:MAG: MFS transporter [Bacteroidetes bacterium]|nr:MFS transporter [Bacteroidota bacterium]
MKLITRTVWILSFISLFTDMASEMLYPIMPIYLREIGFSIFLIGVLEGIAEAVAGLSKGYFGKLSDSTSKRLPFVQLGYMLSAVSKPLMAVSVIPLWVFIVRTFDKLGKGIRTGARDAMLSAETDYENKARVFGFHRSMDTFGAVLGPISALIFLYFYPQKYTYLFFIAFIPGFLTILLSFYLKEKKTEAINKKSSNSILYFFKYWTESSTEYKKLVSGLLVFALFNSSDVFLLLFLKQQGFNDLLIISAYIFYNLVYSLVAYPAGILADKIGLKKIFIAGLLFFATVYLFISHSHNIYLSFFFFMFYGIYSACTEGISKAWISNIIPKKDVATAIGTFSGFQSICAMLASSFAGYLWFAFGAVTTFTITAFAAVLVVVYFAVFIKTPLAKK